MSHRNPSTSPADGLSASQRVLPGTSDPLRASCRIADRERLAEPTLDRLDRGGELHAS
jgi:hypothetical protein